jgi:hypothetical protein
MHHRVTGLDIPMVNCPQDNIDALEACVPWLKVSTGDSHHIVVSRWDQADFDGVTFTVAGPRQKDGSRSRHPIEVRWSDIRKWVRRQFEHRRPSQHGGAINDSSQEGLLRHDLSLMRAWENFWIEVALYAGANGLDHFHQTELRTHMRKWVARNWENPPDEALILARLKGFTEKIKLLAEPHEV